MLTTITASRSGSNVQQPDASLEYDGPPAPQCQGERLTSVRINGCKCSGKHQDPMIAGVKCAPAFYGRDLRGLVVPSLDAPRGVKAGDQVPVHVRFHNATADVMPLVTGGWAKLEVHDATGADVTYAGGCGAGYSASGEDFLVVLTTGGEIDLELPWVAAAQSGCGVPTVNYAPGRYTLVAHTNVVKDMPVATVSATIDVR